MPTHFKDRTHSTPPVVARQYGVSVRKIIEWIESGELKAINLARRGSTRPRYSISAEALAEFERARAVVPEAQPARRLRRQTPPGVREFV